MKGNFLQLNLALAASVLLCAACDEGTFTVPLPSTQARFIYTVSNQSQAPATLTFINKSLNAVSYNWDFGNGMSSTEENPVVTYTEAGNYTVKLTVGAAHEGLHYNKTVYEQTIVIKEKPVKRLYLADRNLGKIKYVDLDDSPFPLVQQFTHSGLGKPYGMCVDTTGEKLYVTDYRYQILYRYSLDGSSVEVLMNTQKRFFDSPFGITMVDNMLVWADSAGIHKSDPDGSNTGILVKLGPSAPEMPLCLAYDPGAGEIYFTNDKYEFSGGVFKVKTDGTGLSLLVSGTNGGAIGIDPPSNRMYYYDLDKGMCLNTLDGKNELVFDSAIKGSMCWGLAIDKEAGKIYYSNRVDMNVKRANLDGSGVEVFIPAGAEINPNAMAIDKARY